MISAEDAVDRLIEMGYLKYAPSSEHPRLRARFIENLNWGFLATERDDDGRMEDRRIYSADNEYLAEEGVGDQLLSMKDVLRAEGVLLDEVEDLVEPDRYDIIVNGQKYPIYKWNDHPDGSDWGMALKGLLVLVNGLLQGAGSEERLYAIYSGNEGMVIFLTKEMFKMIIIMDQNLDVREMPYSQDAIDDDGHLLSP